MLNYCMSMRNWNIRINCYWINKNSIKSKLQIWGRILWRRRIKLLWGQYAVRGLVCTKIKRLPSKNTSETEHPKLKGVLIVYVKLLRLAWTVVQDLEVLPHPEFFELHMIFTLLIVLNQNKYFIKYSHNVANQFTPSTFWFFFTRLTLSSYYFIVFSL